MYWLISCNVYSELRSNIRIEKEFFVRHLCTKRSSADPPFRKNQQPKEKRKNSEENPLQVNLQSKEIVTHTQPYIRKQTKRIWKRNDCNKLYANIQNARTVSVCIQ